MKCPRNHEMVLLLRRYVCDLCDVERRRAQLYNPPPDDEGYVPAPKSDTRAESGDYHWAWKQMEAGKAVVFTMCSHSTQYCLGWGYRIRSNYVEHRAPKASEWLRGIRVDGQNPMLPYHTYSILS